MATLTALLALVGSFIGGAGGVWWGRRHVVDDRQAQAVLAFNQSHVRYAHGIQRLAAILRDAPKLALEKARELLDLTVESVDSIQQECLAAYAAIEMWFGTDSTERRLAEQAQTILNVAYAVVRQASELEPGTAQTEKRTNAESTVGDATTKRQELVEATAHLRGRSSWWRI